MDMSVGNKSKDYQISISYFISSDKDTIPFIIKGDKNLLDHINNSDRITISKKLFTKITAEEGKPVFKYDFLYFIKTKDKKLFELVPEDENLKTEVIKKLDTLSEIKSEDLIVEKKYHLEGNSLSLRLTFKTDSKERLGLEMHKVNKIKFNPKEFERKDEKILENLSYIDEMIYHEKDASRIKALQRASKNLETFKKRLRYN